MPPSLAHQVAPGFNVLAKYVRAKQRVRQIAQGTYAPYAPLWALLRGASIRNIADLAGLNYAKTSAYLRGVTEPPFYAGMKMARAIGCTPDELDTYLAAVQRSPLKVANAEAQFDAADAALEWKRGMTQDIEPPPSGAGRDDD